MIPVARPAEPADFDARVRQPGTRWLAEGRLPVAVGLWWLLLPMLGLAAWLYARDGRVARGWRGAR